MPLGETDTARHWYALYTRPRFEKKIDLELQRMGLESYLPLRSVVRQWSDRTKLVDEPLFSCYVFVHADPKERLLSLRPTGVVRMVSNVGKPSRIPEDQIEAVRRMLAEGLNPEPCDYIPVGEEVEITAGSLMGLRGYLREYRGRERLVVTLHAIRQSVAVEVEKAWVKVVGDV